MDLSFLLGSSVIAVLLVQVGKDLLGRISNRWGALASQVTLLIVSFVLAGIGAFFQVLPQQIVTTTTTIFASSMVLYEVLYKALYVGVIKGGN